MTYTRKKKPKPYIEGVIYRRKDGQPRCYVCNKKLFRLIELREMKRDGKEGSMPYISQQKKVLDSIVRLPVKKGESPLYRHADRCEPGSERYAKSEAGKNFRKNHFGE